MKRIASLLMALVLMFSLIPGNIVFAAAEDNTVITITPSITSVQKSAGTASLYYTVSVTPKSSTAVSVVGFTFDVPEGVTLATTGGKVDTYMNQTDKYWYAKNILGYDVEDNPSGKFSTFAYDATSKHFSASGSNNGGLTETTTLMTIGATIDLNKFSEGDTITLGLVNDLGSTVWSKVGENVSYAPTVSSTAISIPKTPISSASFTLNAPSKGATLPTATAGAATYTAAAAWHKDSADGDDVTGQTAQPGVAYTAVVTLTPVTGETFADTVSVTVNTDPAKSISKNANGTLTVTVPFKATSKEATTITWTNSDSVAKTYGETYTPVEKSGEGANDFSVTEGSNGQRSFLYYTDSACAALTTADNSGAAGEGKAPVNAGTYWVKVKVAASTGYNEGLSDPKQFTINKANSVFAWKEGTLTTSFGTALTLTKDTHYTLTGDGSVAFTYYTDKLCQNGETTTQPTNVGSYWVKATVAAGTNYNGTTSDAKAFTVTKVNAPTGTVTARGYSGTYDGNAHGITVTALDGATIKATIKYGTTEGIYDLDASPTYINAGTHTVYYKVVMDNYADVTGSETVTISKKSITDSMITAIGDQTYTGSAIQPVPEVKDGSKVLVEGTDYTVSYTNGDYVNVSDNRTVKVTGMGNYSGEQSKTFKIVPKELTAAMIGTIANQTYNKGNPLKPTVTVTDGSALTKGTDYEVSYSNNTTVGTATATITGKGNYTGTQTMDFTIDKATVSGTVTATKSVVKTSTGFALAGLDYNNLPDDFGIVSATLNADVSDSSVVADARSGVANVSLKSGLTVGDSATLYVTLTSDNYENVSATVTVNVVNKQEATVTINNAPTAKTFGDGNFTLSAGVSGGLTGGEWRWSSSNESVLTVTNSGAVTIVGAGSATITATYENATHLGSKTATITVNKANVSKTAPTAKTLTYTGSAQDLINAGSATGGTMKYCLSESGTYSTTVPQGTNADTYTVWYKVEGDANHNDVAAQSISVTIAKANATYTAPTAKTLTYTGGAQALVNAGITEHGTFTYGTNGTTYTAEIPTGTNAGTYTVYYKLTGDSNHKDVAAASVTVYISKAAAPVAPTVIGVNCTTDKQNNGKITNVTTAMEYKLSTASTWTACTGTEITGLVPGEYQVRLAATDNVTSGNAATVTIAAHECTFGTYTYNNDATCQRNGTETAHCTGAGCTATNTRECAAHPMTAHTYGVDGKCTVCQAVNPAGTTLSKDAIQDEEDVAALVETGAITVAEEKVALLLEAIQDGTLTTKNEVAAVTPAKEVKEKFENQADAIVNADSSVKSAEVVGYLDISVALVASGTDLGSMNETDTPVTFQVKLADTMLADLEGKLVFVLREHDGVIDKLPATLSADGVLTFSSDKFSTYAIVSYEPVSNGGGHHYHGGSGAATKVESGKTFDAGILAYVGAAISSACGAAYVFGKKTHTKGKREE